MSVTPPYKTWLPLLGIFLAALLACSGSATIIAGPFMGMGIAITFAVLLAIFAVSCLFAAIFLR